MTQSAEQTPNASMEQNDAQIAAIQNFSGKYPKQLWYLFFSEMWERFCFYGMRGMLTFFMVNQLFMDGKAANLQYGATQAWVYAFTFIGGLFADKILGFRKSPRPFGGASQKFWRTHWITHCCFQFSLTC